MEQYQKPVMEITELERIDVLTKSKTAHCPVCGDDRKYNSTAWFAHMTSNHPDYASSQSSLYNTFKQIAT